MHRALVLVLALALVFAPTVCAQFGNLFNNFHFGGRQQQQQQQQQRPRREFPGWDMLHEVHCRAGYVCPSSFVCVPTPADCPCPYPEDIKCVIPDDRPRDEGEGPPFVCARSPQGCDEVIAFARPI